jgi:molybdopterin/thiamine biosynthesis adenylyltransferase
MPGFTEEQIHRYARHIVLPQLGGKGQRKLLDARVLVVGVGGLGSPVSLYLAAAGVGTLGLVDNDVVDISNLQRQIVHRNDRVGVSKVASAAEALRALNPDVNVVQHHTTFSSANALELVGAYDVVVECSDNFASKYLANDACVLTGRPLVWGAVFQFDGQMSVVLPRQGPCYRCIFPTPPPPGSVPSCVEAGVLGALVGVIGCWQALEAIKLLAGIGESLAGRLVIFDGLGATAETVEVKRRNDCALCGNHPTINQLIDYEVFCGLRPAAQEA